MSVRKIKKSYISCVGYFISYKNGQSKIAFESILESDFYMILEFDTTILKYEEQPMQMYYDYSDTQKRRYTPDTLVTYIDGTQKLFEVKYANDFTRYPELLKKIEILRQYIQETYNLEFEVFTDQNITKTILDNYKFLYKFAFIPLNASLHKQIHHHLNTTPSINIQQLLSCLCNLQEESKYILPYVWNYFFQNHHLLNLNQPLTMQSIIHKSGINHG